MGCQVIKGWCIRSGFDFWVYLLHSECILKSLVGGLNQRISVAFGIANGTLRKTYFSPFLYIRFFPTRFYCLKYLQVCVFFVCMKKLQKKQTLLNRSGSLCHTETFIDGHVLFWGTFLNQEEKKCVIVIFNLRFIPLTNCGLKDMRLFYMYVIYWFIL